MHARIRAYVRCIFHDDMARERRRVRHNYIVADQAIVSDVCLRHQETVVTDPRHSAATLCAAMDRHEFANASAASDLCLSFFSGELQILRRQTDRDEWINMSFIAN